MRLLTAQELVKRLGVSLTTIYRWRDYKILPAPVKQPGRRMGWREEEIEQWEADPDRLKLAEIEQREHDEADTETFTVVTVRVLKGFFFKKGAGHHVFSQGKEIDVCQKKAEEYIADGLAELVEEG